MDKARINKLLQIANSELTNADLIEDGRINSSYDGKASALGVSVVMMGLRPTLVSYYNISAQSKISTRKLLDVVAKMICNEEDGFSDRSSIIDARTLVDYAISTSDEAKLRELQTAAMHCSVALKMIIRTYPQYEDNI